MDTNTDAIPAVAAVLATGLSALLRDRLVGVYLGGSFTMGDFVPGASDYDVLVVTDGPLDRTDLGAIDALHRRLASEYPDAEHLEGDYAPRQALVPTGTIIPVPGFAHGRLEPDIHEIMLSADNLANMLESGVAVHGPPATAILPAVTPADVRAAVLDMLAAGPDSCASEQEAATEILGLVRALLSLQTGRPATKSEGVAWAVAHLDERWHELVREADAVRRGAPVEGDGAQLRTALPALYHALGPLYAPARASPIQPANADADA